MILKNIIREFKTWKIVRKTVRLNAERFYAIGFDIDWLGRLYTIVNIPDEIAGMPLVTRKDFAIQNMAIDAYIKESLSDVTSLLTDLHLSDLIMYPSKYERFANTDSILIILAPERHYTKFWKMALYVIGIAGFVAAAVSVLIKYVF